MEPTEWEDGEGETESYARQKVDKNTGEVVDVDPDARPDMDDFMFEFEVEEVEEAKEFLSVKPWKGAVVEPADHPPVVKEKPDAGLELEYVYGYRSSDAKQNLYYNADGNLVYNVATLGVVLDKTANTQTFFGCREVDMTSKQTTSDKKCHNDDVLTINVNSAGGRSLAVTGQIGKSPSVHMWDAMTGEHKERIKLSKGARGVAAIAINNTGEFIATVDQSNDHVVQCFQEGKEVFSGKCAAEAFDIAFSRGDEPEFWVTGKNLMTHVDVGAAKMRNGIFGSLARASASCVTADNQGRAYTGTVKGKIYVWEGNNGKTSIDHHGKTVLTAIMWADGMLYSGGRSKSIIITDTESLEMLREIQLPSTPRAVDVFNGELMAVGLRNGSIIEVNLADESTSTIMQSHHTGEVWGLGVSAGSKTIFTSGDDDQIIEWDPESRTAVSSCVVNPEERRAKKNKASTQGDKPESQASRAVDVNPSNGHVAAGANDGSVTIREDPSSGEITQELRDSGQWIEAVEYSPDGNFLAVGSHDNLIYVYDVNDGYSLIGKCKGHNAAITNIDWSMDSTYLKSVCIGYELLFFTIPDCEQDTSGASNTVETLWASQHCKFGWNVDGIFPKETSGDHINCVDMSEDQSLIATGDDFGLINIFRNPARKGVPCRSFLAHSEHVMRVKFGRGDLAGYVFSVGGQDQALMQWKIVE